MSIKTSFLDDEEYSAADVNAITSRLVGQGVLSALFEDGTTYNVSGLNGLTAAVTERGVAYLDDTALRVVKSGSVYYVQPGTCFFGNGSVTVVDAAEVVEPIAGTVSYVYMISSESLGTNYIEVSETAPDYANNSNIVPLASIDMDGSITDMRFYASAKLPCVQNAMATEVSVTVPASSWARTGNSIISNHHTWNEMTADVDLGIDRITAMIGLSNYEIMVLDGSAPIFYNGSAVKNSTELVGISFNLPSSYPNVIVNAEYISGTTWRITYWASSATDLICSFLCIG